MSLVPCSIQQVLVVMYYMYMVYICQSQALSLLSPSPLVTTSLLSMSVCDSVYLQGLRHWWQLFLCFPGGTVIKNVPANAGDTGDAGSAPELGISPRGGNGNPLQYLCLGNTMDEEPGGLPSMRLQTSWIQLSTIAVAVVQCQHWCLQALLWKFSSSLLAGASSIHQGACSSRTCQTCNQPCWGPATHQSICHKSRRQGQPARAGASHAYYPTHGSWLYQSPRGNAADLGDTARRPGPAGQRGAQRLTQGTAT